MFKILIAGPTRQRALLWTVTRGEKIEKALFNVGELTGGDFGWLEGMGGEGVGAARLGEVFCGPSVHSRMPARSG